MKQNTREGNLIKNTFIITIGKICTQLITFFLLPLYTNILSTEEYGIVDLLNTLVFLLIPIITFQVEQAIFRELIQSRNDEESKSKIISNGIFSVILQCIFFLLICIFIKDFINNDYIFYLIINVIAYVFSSVFLQIARGLGDNKKYSFGSFISAASTIVFNILFLLYFELRATGMLLGVFAGQIICSVYLFISLRLYSYIKITKFDFNVIKNLWKYSLPLIPNAICWWIFSASDRVIVSYALGLGMNGILSAASKFSSVYVTLYNVFNVSWTESISLHIDDEDIEQYFNKTFNIVLKIFGSLAIVILAFMPFAYPILINENYSMGYNIVPILILSSFFQVLIGLISVVYIAKKNTKSIASTSIFSAFINIIVHILLIKYIGIYAAAVSTFASYFIMSMYRLWDTNKKYFKVAINRNIIIFFVCLFIFVAIFYYIENLAIQAICMIIALVMVIIYNKKILMNIINFFKVRR